MFRKGRYRAREAETQADIRAAQRLRHLAFRCLRPDNEDFEGVDADAFDSICTHVLIEEEAGGRLVCCFRVLPLGDGRDIGRSYSAQFYGLAALCAYSGPMAELGRFCIHPATRDPDILRAAWAAMTRLVDANGIGMLFGCSSFKGTDAALYSDAFAMLGARHLAPPRWRPRIKAPAVVRFAERPVRRLPDPRRAMLAMPPLLRSYLAMGGWVSDHAVIDPQMNTLHVFTGLEIAAIPAARQRLLRAAAFEPA